MSDNYYERIGEILNNSFSKNIDPFELANKKDAKKRGYKAYQENKEEKSSVEERVKKEEVRVRPVPKELIKDFLTIKVKPGSSLEECKHSWKCLLKKYHPDLSSNSEDGECEELILINDSYRRIEAWFMSHKN